jgi:hypothetical protein
MSLRQVVKNGYKLNYARECLLECGIVWGRQA